MENSVFSREPNVAEESASGGYVKLTEVFPFWESVPKSLCRVGKGAVAENFREDETGGRDRERYDDVRISGHFPRIFPQIFARTLPIGQFADISSRGQVGRRDID